MKDITPFYWLISLSIIAILLTPFNSIVLAAENEPIPLDTYWDLLRGLQSRLSSESDLGQEELQNFADQLDGITTISLSSGEVIPVDHSYLVGQLRQENPNLNQINQYIATIIDTQATWNQSSFPADSAAKLEEILSAAEFQWKTMESSLLSQWINKILQRFLDFLSSLFPEGIENGSVGIPSLDTILTILGILAVLIILGLVLQQLTRSFVDEATQNLADDPEGKITTSKSAYQQARQLSQSGDYRSAMRYLYLSSLLLLEERKLLRYDRTKTNREYLRDLSDHPELPELEDVLEDVVSVYDRVWYGYQSLEKEDFDQFSARVSDLNKLK